MSAWMGGAAGTSGSPSQINAQNTPSASHVLVHAQLAKRSNGTYIYAAFKPGLASINVDQDVLVSAIAVHVQIARCPLQLVHGNDRRGVDIKGSSPWYGGPQ